MTFMADEVYGGIQNKDGGLQGGVKTGGKGGGCKKKGSVSYGDNGRGCRGLMRGSRKLCKSRKKRLAQVGSGYPKGKAPCKTVGWLSLWEEMVCLLRMAGKRTKNSQKKKIEEDPPQE